MRLGLRLAHRTRRLERSAPAAMLESLLAVRRVSISVLLCALATAHAQPIHLASPRDGAQPRSAYIVIEGEAAPSASIEAFDGDVRAAAIQADALGRFERVLRLAAGRHQIRVKSGRVESTAYVDIGAYPVPKIPAPYELLQTGDVILAHDRDSQQDSLYRPTYTHSALYMGPGPDGAPLLLEAVSEDNAPALGPVAAVPIEESLAWREADRVDAFRLATGLTNEDRIHIVSWARRTAARGLPFRGAADFGDIYRAWLLWDTKSDRPSDAAEFQSLLEAFRERLLALDAYDCATLVWHAYRDNTAGQIDIASPNRIVWGGAAGQVSTRFANALKPLLILPDSFALSGKLRQVTGQ
jgi:hypothetical protein